MSRKQNRARIGIAGVVALAAMAGTTAPAMAGHGRAVAPRPVVETCIAEQTAGRMQIGARMFSIGADYPLFDLVEAFRCAGFIASTDGKSVTVRAPRRRPAMAWTSDLYNARFVISGGCIVITLGEVGCGCIDAGPDHSHERPRARGGNRSGERVGAPAWRNQGGGGVRGRGRATPRIGIGRLRVAPIIRGQIGNIGVSIHQR